VAAPRDALSLLDQATVLGGQTVDEATVRALLGAPRGEVQFEIADVVAVGDVRGVFEVVDRLVLDGRDVRNVTNETIGHFRDLLLVKTAPGQEDLLDLAADAYEGLRVQAEKFSAGELARILALLLAAQNDMRWTTSPRLSLELALIRACLPDTDPTPAGVVSRLERLERLANLAPEAVVVLEEPAEASPPPVAAPTVPPPVAGTAAPPTDESATQMPVPQAADAGSVDVAMLRRSWGALIDHLGQLRQPILRAVLESATVASFDGETLELAFPPDKRFGVQKVQDRQDELQQALGDLFGIAPRITCVVRESREPGGSATAEVVEEEETPSDDEALRRVQEMLGATPVEGGGD
jgi:DNA polymerase-3 subunit gamma/tau